MDTIDDGLRRITTRVDPELHHALRMYCARNRTSAQAIVEEALRRLLVAAGELPEPVTT